MSTQLSSSAHALSIASHRRGPWPSRTARVEYRLPTPTVVVIGVHGEIDASNAGILNEHVAEHATRCHGLILDLAGLKFFGIEGFPALHRVGVSCARTGIGWAVVPGPAVSRTLRICDPQGSLPVAGSVDAAIATFPGERVRRPVGDLRLVRQRVGLISAPLMSTIAELGSFVTRETAAAQPPTVIPKPTAAVGNGMSTTPPTNEGRQS